MRQIDWVGANGRSPLQMIDALQRLFELPFLCEAAYIYPPVNAVSPMLWRTTGGSCYVHLHTGLVSQILTNDLGLL
ncbi:hypothetical protein FACHB389_31560 [Nostoc calcicola FACHB-389]|nr:hypothetical protein [Nostoc calcicola FACHB-3891]OKH21537.1 hypothetical protein FACHB389_31560 [Nostoc calcicola FACHB-389]